jgi:hypothetical protein
MLKIYLKITEWRMVAHACDTARGNLRQESCRFVDSLGYTENSWLTTKK